MGLKEDLTALRREGYALRRAAAKVRIPRDWPTIVSYMKSEARKGAPSIQIKLGDKFHPELEPFTTEEEIEEAARLARGEGLEQVAGYGGEFRVCWVDFA
jgi:hypothetical protein